MGSVQHPELCLLSKNIWQWCESRDLWIFASYVESKENKADWDSRVLSVDTEWELSNTAFTTIIRHLGQPDLDLFASVANSKCKNYFSWLRDPEALAVDAFTVCWTSLNFYAFPPFTLILRVLKKIITDQAEGILVVPDWPSQPWYPVFKNLLISDLVSLKADSNLVHSPFREAVPIPNLTLVAARLSGRPSGLRDSQNVL